MKALNPYLNYLVHTSFHDVNRLFVLSFEKSTDWTLNVNCSHPKVEIKDYNIMIDGQNSFDQPVKNDVKTCNNIQKIATGHRDEYTTGF